MSRRRIESVSTGAALIDLPLDDVLSILPFLFTFPITTISLPSHECSGVLPLSLPPKPLRRLLSRRAQVSSACIAVTLPLKAALSLGDRALGDIGLLEKLLRGLRPSLFSR